MSRPPHAPGFDGGLEPRHHRRCPVCGNADDRRVFAAARYDLARLDEHAFASRKLPEYMHYRLVQCPTCDLVYASPVPSAEALARAYAEAAFTTSDEGRHAAVTYARFLPGILSRLRRRSRALDVGTGTGAFLEALADAGFDEVIGVEPSAAPIAAAVPRVRGWIRHGIFREDDFAPGAADLVSCFQTLEHLDDPAAFCRSAFRLLAPGGGLFLVDHDYRALVNRLLGSRSPIRDIEHLQLFSRRAMTEMLRRCGYTDIRVVHFANRYPLRYWLTLSPLPAAIKRRLIERLGGTRLGRLPVALPVGNMAAVAYRPAVPA